MMITHPFLQAPVSYFLGLDLGQAKDYTALCILERHGDDERAIFHARHLQRFALGTKYPAIVVQVREMLLRAPLYPAESFPVLAVDATGVGTPVVDMLRQENLAASLRAVTITGGDTATRAAGVERVPKRELVSTVQVALQTGRLKIAQNLPEAATLVRELQNFQVKITDSAHDTYGAWREGTHDDLVLAAALALWVGKSYGPSCLL
jgi:hypothetical protein